MPQPDFRPADHPQESIRVLPVPDHLIELAALIEQVRAEVAAAFYVPQRFLPPQDRRG